MKLVILSGAGLSVPSGLPGYEKLKSDINYQHFFSVNKDEASGILAGYLAAFNNIKPNRAHHECVKIEKYCKAFNIDFYHYTLNIDNLIEKAGGRTRHIYGCIDNPDDLVEKRFYPAMDLNEIVWQADDILIVLGVSNDGHPLAFLESIVTSAGAMLYNYNLVTNDTLNSKQIIGDLVETFSSATIISLIPCDFDIHDIGYCEVEIRSFTLNNRDYDIYFSPYLETYASGEEVDQIEATIGYPLTNKAYEVKFDLQINRYPNQSFAKPLDNLQLSELNFFGLVLVTTIESHANLKNAELYTATAANKDLKPFYNRLVKRYAAELNYEQWCSFGADGENYAFKRK